MRIEHDFSLKFNNTFGVEATAKHFIQVRQEQELSDLFSAGFVGGGKEVLFLGSGSNMLFVGDYQGVVLHNCLPGIGVRTNGDQVNLTIGGGVIWNDLVSYCVDRGFGGIENLTLIPGTVGAAPVQNIGAYGVELKDVFISCKAFDLLTGEFRYFDKEECKFSYRESIFKTECKGRFFITEVNLRLSKKSNSNITYGAIGHELRSRGIGNPSVREIAEVVANIRRNKLPDPLVVGNSGSFFKNPIISVKKLDALLSDFVDIVYYPYQDGFVKLAAGWLIDKCGLKGVRIGNTGTWAQQALVLVNYGSATGLEVYNFSEQIIETVESRFSIRLEREVNVIGYLS